MRHRPLGALAAVVAAAVLPATTAAADTPRVAALLAPRDDARPGDLRRRSPARLGARTGDRPGHAERYRGRARAEVHR